MFHQKPGHGFHGASSSAGNPAAADVTRARHRKFVRTTHLIERSFVFVFVEERRRSGT